MQVLNLVILRESESILHESAWLLYFGVYVKEMYCKDLGSDRKDINQAVFYSSTEEYCLSVPP